MQWCQIFVVPVLCSIECRIGTQSLGMQCSIDMWRQWWWKWLQRCYSDFWRHVLGTLLSHKASNCTVLFWRTVLMHLHLCKRPWSISMLAVVLLVGLAQMQFRLSDKSHMASCNAVLAGLLRRDLMHEAQQLFQDMPAWEGHHFMEYFDVWRLLENN